MANDCKLGSRKTIRAFRTTTKVLIVAEGDLPSPGYTPKITMRPERIFPPWYQILHCPRDGFFPQIIVPYKVSLTVNHPEDRDTIRVFHADGQDDVKIEACGDDLAAYAAVVGGSGHETMAGTDEATGFSPNMRFDEAFADAIEKLPDVSPTHPDSMQTVKVEETGAMFGGIAGFHHLYVRVSSRHD